MIYIYIIGLLLFMCGNGMLGMKLAETKSKSTLNAFICCACLGISGIAYYGLCEAEVYDYDSEE